MLHRLLLLLQLHWITAQPIIGQFQAYNGAGESPTATVRSFTTRDDPTIYTLPWLEDFGTTGTTFLRIGFGEPVYWQIRLQLLPVHHIGFKITG